LHFDEGGIDVKLRSLRFLVLGRAGMDLYADPPGARTEEARHFSAALGGSAANIAVAIAKLGGSAALVTVVSDDAVGRFTLNELSRYGVDAGHVRQSGGEVRTSLAVVESRFENCQSVIYRNGAADFLLAEADVSAIPYAEYGALIVTGTSLALEPSRGATMMAMERARKAGITVVLDVDYRPYSWIANGEAAATCRTAAELCQIVIGNDVEFAMMANGGDGLALAHSLAIPGERMTIYKEGEKGSVTFANGRSFSAGIYQVTPLKPTGAGDSFMGGFVTGLAHGLDVKASVLRGSAAAAITVTRVGCAPALPTSAELDTFMAGQPAPAVSDRA
jgi:5-dehydro-2-deoxygluconokinase